MRLKSALVLALLGAASLTLASSAAAASVVTNTNDSGPGSLRQAIAETSPNETIAVPAGDYQISSGPLNIGTSVTLAGHGSADTIIRSVGPFRVMTITPEDAFRSAGLTNLTVRDGRVFEVPGFGGGIFVGGAQLRLRGVVVTGNVVNVNGDAPEAPGGPASGGGIALASSSLTMVDSTVSGNGVEALGGPGAPGGVAQGGGIGAGPGSSVSIERSVVRGNFVKANGGTGPSSPIQDGGVARGGGISGTVQGGSVTASTLSGNFAEAMPGPGGVSGEAAGGAVSLTTVGNPLEFTDATIAQNVARNGSGEKPAFGGGIFASSENFGASIVFTATTVAANKLETTVPGSQGGNLVLAGGPGTAGFRNTIVAAGIGPPGSENCGFGGEPTPVVSQGFNLDSLDQCNFKGTGDKVGTNPLLGPLAANGGGTETMVPGAGSPAVDQGAAFGLTADQRGVTRPIDFPSIPNSTAPGADGTDIGAVEVQPVSSFTVGRARMDRKRGIAKVTVTLPAPALGTLSLGGKAVRGRTVAIDGARTALVFTIKAKGRALKQLRRKGRRTVGFSFTYSPTANAPTTNIFRVKLVKKKRKHRRR